MILPVVIIAKILYRQLCCICMTLSNSKQKFNNNNIYYYMGLITASHKV
jgi:hypothetical protein